MGVGHQGNGYWEFVPPSHLERAFRSTDYDYRAPVPKDWVLRGSGIHGPENGDVMKLIIWNRMKQRRPQRVIPCLADQQENSEMEVAIVWWTFWIIFAVAPLNWWAKRYRMVHDTYPWMPKRIDGTKGYGNCGWFME